MSNAAEDRFHLPMLPRPQVRGDCLPGGLNEARPCPWNTCRYHLEHPEASCVLDVADRGGATLEEVGEYIGVTRERIRQIEALLLARLKKNSSLAPWHD